MDTFRGRGNARNFNRNRSRSRPSRNTRRDFFDKKVEEQEATKLKNTQDQMAEKKAAAAAAPKDMKPEGIDLIEKGKAWLNKHFKGMQKEEHGNIKVELNENIDMQIYELYENRVKHMVSMSIMNDRTESKAKHFLRPWISTCIGIKLLKANTTKNRASTLSFRGIEELELYAPKKMGTIINSIGKTDAIDDNTIRLRYQNLIAKRYLFKAVVDYYGYDSDLYDRNISGRNVDFREIQSIRDRLIKNPNLIRIYDNSIDGTAYVNYTGRKIIKNLLNMEFGFVQSNTLHFKCRLPDLKEEDFDNLEAILKWIDKVTKFASFCKFIDDNGNASDLDMAKIISQVILAYIPNRWIRKPTSTYAELDSRFEDSVIKDVTVEETLHHADFYNMNNIMEEDDIVNNVLLIYQDFRQVIQPIYNEVFDMGRFIPIDYGSAAQMVTGHTITNRFALQEDEYDKLMVVKDGRYQSFVRLKDQEALLGSVFKFSDKTDFISNYYINTEGKSSEIRLDYVATDFRTR